MGCDRRVPAAGPLGLRVSPSAERKPREGLVGLKRGWASSRAGRCCDSRAVPATVADHHSAFGGDRFGRAAESAARFFGTPQYIVAQSVAVVVWLLLNSIALVRHWDPYPFILLNLAFSTQAAYAAPLILLAQTRQAERDAVHAALLEDHRQKTLEESLRREDEIEKLTTELRSLLETNTRLTREIRDRVGR